MKVEAKHISIVFNNAYVIKQKNFCLENMQSVLLQGNNGTGKTTLIKALAGIKSLDAGEINYFSKGVEIDKKTFQKKLGLCLGVQFLCLDMTLEENFKLYYEKFYQDAYVQSLLDNFLLNHKLQQPLNTLSKGELQKAALCRALLFDPEVVFLDEPFDGLDQTAQKQLIQWIEGNKHKKSMLLCTHINGLPESFFDQVWDLNQ
ncbi:MAG TPA: ATP-binding cassette domain-containing protein [Oligoflexia bacterium]|nr:ATP-binding cassette domain-containing protein [Oligoflexia bacterium]HMR25639.1 ATP-binding cassette domain-containing protein [Oligoflexia bacterium]